MTTSRVMGMEASAGGGRGVASLYPHPRHPWLLLGVEPRDSHVESCFLHQQPHSSPQGRCWWGCVVTVVPACLVPWGLAARHPLMGTGYPVSPLCLAPGGSGFLPEARSL